MSQREPDGAKPRGPQRESRPESQREPEGAKPRSPQRDSRPEPQRPERPASAALAAPTRPTARQTTRPTPAPASRPRTDTAQNGPGAPARTGGAIKPPPGDNAVRPAGTRGSAGTRGTAGTSNTTGPTKPTANATPATPHRTPPPLPPALIPDETDPADAPSPSHRLRYTLSAVLLVAGAAFGTYAATSNHKTPAAPTSATDGSTSSGDEETSGDPAASQGAVPVPSSDPGAEGTTPSGAASATTTAAATTTTGRAATTTTGSAGTTKPPVVVGGSGQVTSLTVTFGPDASGASSYTAHVKVHTKSTAAVTVTLVFAGSDNYGSPGSIAPERYTFTLSGQTSYNVQQSIDDSAFCPALYAGVHVTAPGGVSAYKDAPSSC